MGCPVSLLLALAAAAETHASSQGLAAIERRLDEQASELAALRARVATLEAETAATAKTSVVLSPLGGSQQGVEGAQAARRLSHATPQTSCCRWTASDTCTTVTRQCTELHEYLESKTTTHEFFDVEHANCLGPDSSSTWSWAYDGHKGNVTLSSDGSAVTAFKTPLRVTHAQDCSTVLPTLTLQLDTQVDGALSVAGALSAPNGLTSATSSVILHPGGLDDLYLYFCYSLDCFSSGSTGSKWSTGPRFSADSTDWTPMTWSSGFNTGDMPGLRSVMPLADPSPALSPDALGPVPWTLLCFHSDSAGVGTHHWRSGLLCLLCVHVPHHDAACEFRPGHHPGQRSFLQQQRDSP
tara:strand:- start:680 stop:1738 length:1059 start_codon:yes stop_codon:yes gene_type:complete